MHAITWLWANEDLTQGSWHCNHIRGGKNQSTVVSINQYHNTSEIRFRAEIANYSNSQEEWIINSASDNTQNETLEYARVRMTHWSMSELEWHWSMPELEWHWGMPELEWHLSIKTKPPKQNHKALENLENT